MSNGLSSIRGFLRPAAPMQAAPGRDLPPYAATTLIAATFVLCTVHVTPFADLQSVKTIEVGDGGSLFTQIAYTLLFAAAQWLMARVGLSRMAPLATPALTLLTAWIGVSTLLSQAPEASIRKLALTFICVFLAAALLLAARSVHHFARTLALTTFFILVLSYVSVALAPDYATHTSLDLREPDLAGDWRGPFPHKNEAGAMMALFVFVGLLAWGTGMRWLGAAITAGGGLFLILTHSKTALVLLPAVLLQVGLARVFTGTMARLVLLLGPVAVVGGISLGSYFYRPLREALRQVAFDASFTGRTEVWEFAVEHVMKRPIAGWGYGAFWRTEATALAYSGSENWFAQADQAHNTYLDTALFMGLPGLALTVLAFVAMPLRDLQNAAGGRRLDAMGAFFLSVWLYVLCTGFFETVLFEGNSALFLMFMLALFGLRYRTMAQTVAR